MAKQEHALPLEVVHAIEAWSIDAGQTIVEDDRILNPDVELAIRELFWYGCDPIRLLEFILGYCTPDPEDGDRKRTPDEFDNKEIFNVPLSEPLEKLARQVARMVWNSFGALMTLVLNGYGNDAIKIAREMFEASVTLGYLRMRPELVDDYFDYHWIIQKQMYDYMSESAPHLLKRISADTIKQMQINLTRVATRFAGKSGKVRKSWAKASFRDMAKEVGKEELYLTFYRYASSMHHTDIGGVFAQAEHSELEDILDVDLAPSDNWFGEALIIGHGAVVAVLKDYNEITKVGLNTIVEQAFQMFMEAWGQEADGRWSKSQTDPAKS